MERLETKAYEEFAVKVFSLAYDKFGSYEEVGDRIGVSGHCVSDVAKGKYKPNAPLFLACMQEVVPWLPGEIWSCLLKAEKKIQDEKAAAAVLVKKGRSPDVACLSGRPEEVGV